MELPIELMFILGILSSVIVWILKEVFVKKGKEVPLWVYNIALGVVALGLALLFTPVILPPFPPLEGGLIGILLALLVFVGELIPVLFGVIGFARMIYEVLLKRVLDGLGGAFRRAIA